MTLRTNGICSTQNDTYKVLRDFDIETDHLISASRPDLRIVNQKQRTCRTVYFAIPVDYRVRLKEGEKKDRNQDIERELKKTMEYESVGDINCNRYLSVQSPKDW